MPIRGRRSRRFVVEDATVEYRKHSPLPFLGGAPKVSPLVNLSVGGLQFVSDDFFEPGQRLDLKVMIPSAFRALSIRGEVVWARRIMDRDSFRTGVRFTEPTAEDVSLLRSLEERYWSISEERKRHLEELIAQRYPLRRERAEAPAAPRAEQAAPEEEKEAPEPAPEPPPPEPVEEAPAPAAEEPPETVPLARVPVYDLVTGIETRPDAAPVIQGVQKYEVVLPGITDPDCFALELHDNTMHHNGTPSFGRGDLVVFSSNVPARSGDLAFVVTRDGGLFRQVFFDANNMVRLRPLNSWHPEQRYPRSEVQGLWRLLGRYESFLEK